MTILRQVRFAVLAAAASLSLAGLTAAQTAEEVPSFVASVNPKALVQWQANGQPLGIERKAFERFIAASSLVIVPGANETADVSFYDLASACVLHGQFSNGGVGSTMLSAASHNSSAGDLIQLALASFEQFLSLSVGEGLARDRGCASTINATYGPNFDRVYRELSGLRRDTESYLLASSDRFGSMPPDKAKLLKARLVGARRLMEKPVFLSYIETGDRVTLVFGDPKAAVRWVSQYDVIGNGRWRFNMGFDAVLLTIDEGGSE